MKDMGPDMVILFVYTGISGGGCVFMVAVLLPNTSEVWSISNCHVCLLLCVKTEYSSPMVVMAVLPVGRPLFCLCSRTAYCVLWRQDSVGVFHLCVVIHASSFTDKIRFTVSSLETIGIYVTLHIFGANIVLYLLWPIRYEFFWPYPR